MIRPLICAFMLTGVATQAVEAQLASHRVKMVATQPGVRLEVLDWGGAGPPLVFLSGFGNTGHVFDEFAPQFTNRSHVLAITRRGFGASSRPSSGYDTGTLAHDITSVLDALGIRRATFVGHSFAGNELNYLGAFYADRVAQLVYLDASYDFPRLYSDPRWKHAFPIPRPAAPTSRATDDWLRWFALVMGPGVPDDEIRILKSASGPDLSETLERGAATSAFRRIRAPVLALWAAPRSVEDQYPYWRSLDSADRARLQASFADQQTVRQSHFQGFQAEVSHARAITVVGGRHYLFLSHRTEVTNAMNAFLASSPSQPNEAVEKP
jgi:pimeloyl-ACP methyl ester carboxylesterase